jgi:hypothetical protein
VKYFTTRHESPATCGKNQVLFLSVTCPAMSGICVTLLQYFIDRRIDSRIVSVVLLHLSLV